jgi:archaetidylinositol phosphate synthase
MTEERANATHDFHEAQRHLAGLTARAERRALLWLAPRTPAAITSDHLTLLGLASMAACGALYAASGHHPWLLLLVNLALALNWLGDSLDGTLARYRGVERPRFGFYVDHLVDAFGALLVLGGLALSGLMSPLVAAGLLVAYFLLAIETYLATYAIGRFKVSWGPLGGTELRILLATVNVLVLFRPRVSVAGVSWLLFDIVGVPASAALLALAVAAGVRGTRALARAEGWAPRARGDRGLGGHARHTRLAGGNSGALFSPPGPPRCVAPRTPSVPTAS